MVCLCVFSPRRNHPPKPHIKENFANHPVPGQSCECFYVYVFSFPDFQAPRDIPAKIPGHLTKELGFPGFQETYRTFWHPLLHGEGHPTRRYADPKVWVCDLFPCLCSHVCRLEVILSALLSILKFVASTGECLTAKSPKTFGRT